MKKKTLLGFILCALLLLGSDCPPEPPETCVMLIIESDTNFEHLHLMAIRCVDTVLYYQNQMPEGEEYKWSVMDMFDLQNRDLSDNPVLIKVTPGHPDSAESFGTEDDVIMYAVGNNLKDHLWIPQSKGITKMKFEANQTVEAIIHMSSTKVIDRDMDLFSVNNPEPYKDCNDMTYKQRPFGPEFCDDEVDNNCNGTPNENCP